MKIKNFSGPHCLETCHFISMHPPPINDIQKIVMSDTMIVRSLERSIIHLAHLSINKDVRNITKMTDAPISDDAESRKGSTI